MNEPYTGPWWLGPMFKFMGAAFVMFLVHVALSDPDEEDEEWE